jgi:4-hydroxy-tetrahydrodipicolinate synthase
MLTDLQLRLRGIVTVLNTPFTANNHIDIDALKRNVASALDEGVSGFLVPAMASEVEKLSPDERLLMAQTVVTEVAGRTPVIGGASAATQEARLEQAQRLTDSGCDGVLVNMPFEDEGRYARAVREIAAVTPFLMLQDWDFRGFGLPIPLITRLFEEVDSFQSLKIEVVPAGVKYTQVLEATGRRLHIAGGWAVMQMIEALDRGVHSIMPTGMHSIYTRIFSLYASGNRDGARDLFYRLLPVLAFSNQHLDISIHFFKRLLFKQGIYAIDRVRQPILPFDEHHVRVADELIDYAIALMEDVVSQRKHHEF